ncbi:uncharacterized protein LOC110460379 [Mizuhopecten yessoensis]|uniref:uncharacterized protein LOC110460379 n=1 Tax=Mizuhopecten yessoensis TaxID=6573 RepID=UPI000B457850|nr:uncharacterized protein LOC110460379 [Mizuhopecten yessoensis]
MYPLIFAFLPDKCQITYQRLFEIVKTAAANNNTPLNPTTTFLDFESSARNAAETVFPQASIKGCLFHYCNRIWRKVQKLGLADQYTNDNLLNLHIRRASALPLVPINQVDDVWFHAIEDYETDDAKITKFNDYVTEQWIGMETAKWNHYSTVGPRTTNHLEGWHHKLNNQLHRAHPNLYVIIEKLKHTQAANEIRLIQYTAGGTRKTRKLKYRILDSRLQRQKQRLIQGEVDIYQYTDTVSRLLKLQ